MYDRHNPIIKWYEYDANKLLKKAEATDTSEETVKDEQPVSATGNKEMDDEVARIMAQFADAKQNSVDDVFAAMAENSDNDNPLDSSTGSKEMDDEVARIMAQFADAKQNSVDDVFAAMAADADNSETVIDKKASEKEEQEELLSSLLKPKQSTVDDLVAMAKEK
ncbi:MAG: hypothetical protein K6E98_01560 [Lachnospiraceae bacterium]|nr:hypothetical protein [Lachnospiraceae bacterium]